jgi:hypothetical protein
MTSETVNHFSHLLGLGWDIGRFQGLYFTQENANIEETGWPGTVRPEGLQPSHKFREKLNQMYE